MSTVDTVRYASDAVRCVMRLDVWATKGPGTAGLLLRRQLNALLIHLGLSRVRYRSSKF